MNHPIVPQSHKSTIQTVSKIESFTQRYILNNEGLVATITKVTIWSKNESTSSK